VDATRTRCVANRIRVGREERNRAQALAATVVCFAERDPLTAAVKSKDCGLRLFELENFCPARAQPSGIVALDLDACDAAHAARRNALAPVGAGPSPALPWTRLVDGHDRSAGIARMQMNCGDVVERNFPRGSHVLRREMSPPCLEVVRLEDHHVTAVACVRGCDAGTAPALEIAARRCV